MRAATGVTVLLAGACLAACSPGQTDGLSGGGGRGRYAGVGLYPAGEMWRQLARPAPAQGDAAAARLDDDEQVIVTLDTTTGELRQCGNLSGHCVSLNPWRGPAPAAAPAALTKHAAELEAEARAQEPSAR